MKKISLFFAFAALFASCNNNKTNEKTNDNVEETAIKTDTLAYKYDSVKVYSKNIAKTEATRRDTAKAVITYPIFENKELNNYIQRRVLDYFSKEDPSIISYQEITNSFIRGYDSFFDSDKNTPQSWFLMIDIKVLRQTTNYIALKYTYSDYVGGAHGNTLMSFINYNPKTNQPIALDSLIDTNKKAKLVSIAERIFRKNEKLTSTESLTTNYFFDKGKFALAQSFYVGDKGLVFLYNPYEIKAYAYGTTELIIPFADLKDVAKPNTILTSTN